MFQRLFSVFFKNKMKQGYILLAIQTIAAIVISIISVIGFRNGHFYLYDNGNVGFFLILIGVFASLAVIALIVFFGITCFNNESYNSNQSYRLLAISDTKYFLANILSSFVALIVMNIINLLFVVLFSILAFVTDQDFRINTISIWQDICHDAFKLGADFYLTLLQIVVWLILLIFVTYVLISFLNFSSKAILNFLPGFSNRPALFFVRGLLILVISWLIIKVMEPINWLLASNVPGSLFYNDPDLTGFFYSSSLIFVIIFLVFLLADLFLFNRYFEPKD